MLKALTYAPTGGIVAAPTTSLPEWIGGVRNWDYRYCWLRDASLTLLAMLSAGYRDEAHGLARVAPAGGGRRPRRGADHVRHRRRAPHRGAELAWLPGFAGSRPGAGGQCRLAPAPARHLRRGAGRGLSDAAQGIEGSEFGWSLIKQLLAWLADHWREKDAGIWEVRGPLRDFTHSKMMAWVAFDRAVRMHEEFGATGRWIAGGSYVTRSRPRCSTCGWSERKQAFTQSYGSDELDASILLMPIVGFLPADDPRFVSTVEAIQRELSVDGLLLSLPEPMRNGSRAAGGRRRLPRLLVLAGRRCSPCRAGMDEAGSCSSGCSACATTSDCWPRSTIRRPGRQLGNFPQAFTHLALVEAAIALDEGRPAREPAAPR